VSWVDMVRLLGRCVVDVCVQAQFIAQRQT